MIHCDTASWFDRGFGMLHLDANATERVSPSHAWSRLSAKLSTNR
jgi:hypothetical protein